MALDNRSRGCHKAGLRAQAIDRQCTGWRFTWSQGLTMWRILFVAGLGSGLMLACGCQSACIVPGSALLRPDSTVCVENPIYVPLGPATYGVVFEQVLDVIDDYFEIAYRNR